MTRFEDQCRKSEPWSGRLFFFVLHFLDSHIAKFVGVEDFTAIEALNEFNVVFACHYADPGMLADRIHGVLVGK